MAESIFTPTNPAVDLLPDRVTLPSDMGIPVLSVVADPTSTPPSYQIAVGWTAAKLVTITRRDPDGQKWPVRQADPAQLDGTGYWVGIDYEAGYGTAVSYDMTSPQVPGVVVHFDADPLVVPAQWRMALIHPGAPALSVPVEFYEGTRSTVTWPVQQQTFTVPGRRNPVVLSDLRGSDQGELVVWCDDATVRNQLRGVVANGETLKIACDPALGFDVPQTYVSLGAGSEVRLVPTLGTNQRRTVSFPFVEVDRPAGQYQAVWNCLSVLAQFPTIARLELTYPTCGDLVLGRGTVDNTTWICLSLLDTFATCTDMTQSFATCADLFAGNR